MMIIVPIDFQIIVLATDQSNLAINKNDEKQFWISDAV